MQEDLLNEIYTEQLANGKSLAALIEKVSGVDSKLGELSVKVSENETGLGNLKLEMAKALGTYKGICIVLSVIWAIFTFAVPMYAK